MNRLQAAEQLRRAVQLVCGSLPEAQALEVAAVYPAYEAGRTYEAGQYLTHGVNPLGDPQLYRVAQAHTSAEAWPPDASPALYEPLGLDGAGYPLWSPPAGAHDAYSAGDVVSHEGVRYRSLIDGNTTVPGSDGRWWELHLEA